MSKWRQCRPWPAHVEAPWKRQTAAERSSYVTFRRSPRVRATGGSRPQHVLAPYKQEVPVEPGTAHLPGHRFGSETAAAAALRGSCRDRATEASRNNPSGAGRSASSPFSSRTAATTPHLPPRLRFWLPSRTAGHCRSEPLASRAITPKISASKVLPTPEGEKRCRLPGPGYARTGLSGGEEKTVEVVNRRRCLSGSRTRCSGGDEFNPCRPFGRRFAEASDRRRHGRLARLAGGRHRDGRRLRGRAHGLTTPPAACPSDWSWACRRRRSTDSRATAAHPKALASLRAAARGARGEGPPPRERASAGADRNGERFACRARGHAACRSRTRRT